MNVTASKPSVWRSTAETAYNQLRAGRYAAFLSEAQQCRLERIRQARMLFDGQHREYYLDEKRSQFNFGESLVQGEIVKVYTSFNVLGLTSRKFADLLFGEAPVFQCDDEIQKTRLDDLVKRCGLSSLLHTMAADCSYEGEAFIEAVIWNGAVWLHQVGADEIMPEGDLRPDGQYASYVRCYVENAGTAEKPIWLLLRVRYSAGLIERTLCQLDNDGKIVREGLDLSAWPPVARGEVAIADLPARQPTGIDRCTIAWVPNMMVRGEARSDYDGSPLKLQDQLNGQSTILATVLAKHGEPPIAAPAEAADNQGNARSSNKLWWYQDPERIPKYIVRDLQLEGTMAAAKNVLSNLLIDLEMSAVLLGLQEGSQVDAWRKLKLNAQNALKKASRKAAYWSAGIVRAIEIAQALEQTLPGMRYDRVPVGVEIRDGIPDDPVDQANAQATFRSAGLLSRRRGLMQQMGDTAAVEAEISELDAEKESEMPSVLMNEPSPLPSPGVPGEGEGGAMPGGQGGTGSTLDEMRRIMNAINGPERS